MTAAHVEAERRDRRCGTDAQKLTRSATYDGQTMTQYAGSSDRAPVGSLEDKESGDDAPENGENMHVYSTGTQKIRNERISLDYSLLFICRKKLPRLTTPLVRGKRTMIRYPGDPSRKVTHSTHDPVTHCPICSGGYIAHILKTAIL